MPCARPNAHSCRPFAGQRSFRPRDLRDDLQALIGELRASGGTIDVASDRVAAIDAALDRYAVQLREVADGIAISQFRASLSEADFEEREEVAALLDLLLEEADGIVKRLSLIDYLITALSLARTESGWAVVVDPPNASELTHALAMETPACDSQHKQEIIARFERAREQLSVEKAFESVLREMAAYKLEIAEHLFNPDILRCVVGYNLAFRVLREEQLSKVREEDRVAELDISAPREPVSPAAAAEPVVQDASPESVLGSPGLAALESALDSRLKQAPCPPGPVASLAGLLDLSIVDDRDVPHLRGAGSSEHARLLKRILVLGLIAQRVDELQKPLSAAGIDPVVLVREWMGEMSDFVRARSNEMVTSGRYLEAKELSDLHARLLFLPFAKRSQVAEAETVVAQRSEAAAASAAREEAVRRARRGTGTGRAEEKKAPARPASGQKSGSRIVSKPPMRFADVAQKLLLVVMCIAMGLVWYDANRVRPDRNSVETLSDRQLQALSPYLVSGTKDVAANRALFMGVLEDRWFQMGELDQRAAAEVLRRRLAAMRLHNVMLFNRHKALKIHYEGSLNRMPGWPPIPDE